VTDEKNLGEAGAVADVAGKLNARQQAVLLRFRDDTPCKMADGTVHYSRAWMKASELATNGSTMLALQTVGGVDPKTLECGPCLVTPDWSREGCHWSMTDLGHAVRKHLSALTSQGATASDREPVEREGVR
jgi:hypothetical protein